MTDSVTYDAVLDVRRETVLFLSGLPAAERQRLGTRAGRRAMGCFKQAVMVLRWFLDGARVAQLARDTTIGGSTAYRYAHERIEVLCARQPSLHAAAGSQDRRTHPPSYLRHVASPLGLVSTVRGEAQMSGYAGDVAGAFGRSRGCFERLVAGLAGTDADGLTHAQLEDRLGVAGRGLLRLLLQDHLDLRAVREARCERVVGADEVPRTRVEVGHGRGWPRCSGL